MGGGSPGPVPAFFPAFFGRPAWAGVRRGLSRRSSRRSSVAPHGRGFADKSQSNKNSLAGRPAWAGVRPRSTILAHRLNWSPRMGGGSPSPYTADSTSHRVAPHGRGSPESLRVHRGRSSAAPHGRGFAPRQAECRGVGARPPRNGGGLPDNRRFWEEATGASPHWRFFAVDPMARTPVRETRPAWTGVRRILRAPGWLHARLPRMGGGSPIHIAMSPTVGGVAPHGRGFASFTERTITKIADHPARTGVRLTIVITGDGT